MTSKRDEILDELLKDVSDPKEIFGQEGLLKQLTKGLVERALEGELSDHLGYKKSERSPAKGSNSRNGKSFKKLKGDLGEIDIEIPRDREGSFSPRLIEKHQTRFDGFDDKIIAMYAHV